MKIIKIAALVIGVVLSQSAFASAIFSWKTTSLSEAITSVQGRIELTDAAAKVGTGAYSIPPNCWVGGSLQSCTDASSPFVSFVFTVNGQNLHFYRPEIGMTFWKDSVFNASFSIDGDRLNFGMYGNDTESELWLGSGVGFRSDNQGTGCGGPGICHGAEGYFERVPEPGSLALMGLGVVLAVHRRRKLVGTSNTLVERSA